MGSIKSLTSGAFVAGFFLWLGWNKAVSARILEVGAGQHYHRLQQALVVAQNGDEIRLQGGVYREGPLVIDKSIILRGFNQPILDGEYKETILRITAPDVVVQGLTLRNTGFSYTQDYAAIRIEAPRARIENNRIENAFFGLYLSAADQSVIRSNVVLGQATKESNSGNAIHVWKSEQVMLEDNQVSGHRDGFYFEFVKNSVILHNVSSDNLRYGLHFMFSDGNRYEDNRFERNGSGVAVMYTRNILMRRNEFLNNWGPTAYGLLLKDISNSEIRGNFFRRNTTGLHMEGSNRLRIDDNFILNNGWAVRLHANCSDNRFSNNIFMGNAFDIATNGSDNSQTGNIFNGNYWDKYGGYDLNKDQVGDVPYHPVSIFSRLVERIPPALILLRSFFVQAIDFAEHIVPILTPKTLVDEKPLMKSTLRSALKMSLKKELRSRP